MTIAASPPSWQSRLVTLLVRARMRPHVRAPIDPVWVRAQMGRPRSVRRWMTRTTGARWTEQPADRGWPGGEIVSDPAAAASDPVVLYLHGGGYIACSPETHRPLVGSLVGRLRAQAWVPRYRLAPEHPFPAALDDAMAAYRYLLDVQGVDPSRLVVMGDSAGGGLALALVQAVRDAGWPRPAAVACFSPWTDLAATGASLDENSDRCAMFAGETIRRATRFYLGAADPSDPRVSPLYGDFTGFPPLLLHASTDEVLRDDSVRVAERARAAGIDVDLALWPRVPHVWQFFAAVLPEARASLDAVQRFVGRCTGPRVADGAAALRSNGAHPGRDGS